MPQYNNMPTTYQYGNQPATNYQNSNQYYNYNQYQVRPYTPPAAQMPQYSYQQSYQQQPAPQSGPRWVQGMSGAKASYVEPGKSDIFMDSESNKFYIKSVDPSGMPLPLRTFRYTEEVEEADNRMSGTQDMSQYVTKEDFKNMLEEYLGPINGSEKK